MKKSNVSEKKFLEDVFVRDTIDSLTHDDLDRIDVESRIKRLRNFVLESEERRTYMLKLLSIACEIDSKLIKSLDQYKWMPGEIQTLIIAEIRRMRKEIQDLTDQVRNLKRTTHKNQERIFQAIEKFYEGGKSGEK